MRGRRRGREGKRERVGGWEGAEEGGRWRRKRRWREREGRRGREEKEGGRERFYYKYMTKYTNHCLCLKALNVYKYTVFVNFVTQVLGNTPSLCLLQKSLTLSAMCRFPRM